MYSKDGDEKDEEGLRECPQFYLQESSSDEETREPRRMCRRLGSSARDIDHQPGLRMSHSHEASANSVFTNHNVSCVHNKGEGISARSLDLDFVGAKVLRV
jgi:hypothetical protein